MIRHEEPSVTALMAAAARAAHLTVDDEPLIYRDTLAHAFLADRADELIGFHRAHGTHVVLAGARANVTVRGRYTEERLAAAARRGTTQYVILGAGLDSFAYRSPLAARVRTFEVDHPATQRWKRRTLAGAGIAPAGRVTYVETDFETHTGPNAGTDGAAGSPAGTPAGSLAGQLIRGGLDPARPALVSWLGVTMYLTRAAIGRTLAAVARLAPGTELIAEYMVPEDLRDEAGQAYAELVAPVAAERGEPWLTLMRPGDMSALLDKNGFGPVTHIPQREAVEDRLWDRTDSLGPASLCWLADASVRRARPETA
jgi:O-methyltransferase involved in polyketide biosynthesis